MKKILVSILAIGFAFASVGGVSPLIQELDTRCCMVVG